MPSKLKEIFTPKRFLIVCLLLLSQACAKDELTLEGLGLPNSISKEWTFAWADKSNDYVLLEFVKRGEKIESWTELFSVHLFLTPQPTPKEYYLDFTSLIKKGIPNAIFSTTILTNDPKAHSIFFEWNIFPPHKEAQQEWALFYQLSDGAVMYRYTTKKVSTPKQRQEARSTSKEIFSFL